VTSAGATAKGQVTTWHGSATSKTKSSVDEAGNRATQTGSEFANQGKSAVDASAGKVQSNISSTAGAVQGQSGGGGGANQAAQEGNAKVASKVSGETAGKVNSQGSQVVSGVKGQGGKIGSTFQQKGKEAATAIKSTLPGAISQIQQITSHANSAVQKGVSSGHSALGQVQSQASKSLSAQQGAATKQISSTVSSTKAALAKGAAMAHKAVSTQHAAATKGLHASAAKMRAMVKKAPILRDDAAGVSGEIKQDLKGMSSRGIVAGGKTAKLATNATGGAAKSAKGGIAQGASAASGSASQTASGASSGAGHVASSVGTQVQSTAHSATAAGDKTVSAYTGKVKSSVGKVKGKFSEGLNTTKGEMADHEAKVQGGTQQIPGQNSGKVSEGQAKVNAASQKEPEKPHGLWGHIVSAAKWVAEKLKAAFQFVAKLLTDPGFWVSLIVAVALTAFVIATFGSGLAVLVVAGAIIGAISAGAGQIVTNVVEGKKWNEGLGTAMLVGGITGMIPGAGKALGTVGSKIVGKFGGKIASSAIGKLGSKITSSALGKGVQALSRGVAKGAGKLAELGSKAGKTLPGKILTAPFRAAERLGTKAGTAVRSGAEKRFPGMFGSGATKAASAGEGKAASEAASAGEGKSASEAAEHANKVADDATTKAAKVEEPPNLQERIDNVTGVKKGPEYERAQQQLKDFYENQAKEASQTAKDVSTYRTDPTGVDQYGNKLPDYGIPGRFEAREFAYEGQNLTEVTMKVHLRAKPGVSADDLAKVQRDAWEGVDRYYNAPGHTLPNGNKLHVNVEFTDDPALAHVNVDIHPGGKAPTDRANQVNWYVDSEPTTHAHELGHSMGLLDEYTDPTALNRLDEFGPGYHDDGGLMTNYWTLDPKTGKVVPNPNTHVPPRNLNQIGQDIDNAAGPAHTGTPKPGGGTPAPAAHPNAPKASDWPEVQAKHPAVSGTHKDMLKELEVDPQLADRLLSAGVKADDVVLRGIENPELLEVMDGLTKHKIQGSVANKVAQNAGKLDGEFPGLLRNVKELATNPNMRNPQALNGLLDDIAKGKAGAVNEIDRAVQRLNQGHDIQLGAQNRIGGDVVDYTDQEVMQMKDVSSAQTDAVGRNMEDAANQLAGKGSKGQRIPGEKDTEVPPTREDGTPFTRTIDVTLRNPENPLYNADREQVEQFVREEMAEIGEKESVDRVVITTGKGVFVFEGPW
jgi:hypothetical protein